MRLCYATVASFHVFYHSAYNRTLQILTVSLNKRTHISAVDLTDTLAIRIMTEVISPVISRHSALTKGRPVSFPPRGGCLTGTKKYTSGLLALPSPRRTPAPRAYLSGPLYTDELPRKICQTKLILDTSPGKDSACVCNLPYLSRNRQQEQRRDNVTNHNKLVRCF
jgi:hypothetical protein